MNRPEYCSDCPQFSLDMHRGPQQANTILLWASASVVWEDTFVDSRGNKHKRPEYASWVLSWKHGVVDLASTDESKARIAAALLIYLWCKGVDIGIAVHCARGLHAEFR